MSIQLYEDKRILQILLLASMMTMFSCSQEPGDRAKRLVQQLDLPVEQAMKRLVAMQELEDMGKEAVPALLAGLKDNAIDIRFQSARILGLIQAPEAKPALRDTLKNDASIVVKLAAATALAKMGDDSGYTLAMNAVKSNDEHAVEKAVIALGDIGDKRAVPKLLEVLNSHGFAGSEAARALGKIGDKTAVEPLIRALGRGLWMKRWYAAEALGKIGDEKALPVLREALKDEESEVREAAQEAIRRIEEAKTE